MDKEKIPPKKFGLLEARTASQSARIESQAQSGKLCLHFLAGLSGGGSTPGAASPHSGRFKGVTGGLEGSKGRGSAERD